ncbi:MAG: PTS IIA-like nitrogen regulatory protein PtsN [Pseudomonadales bacterium]|nr:PTS IIA-like nitrogen regulatory protein PtsN [Pseudomonadales bacterium]
MTIEDILTRERTCSNISLTSKKRTFEYIADFLARSVPEIDADELFEHLTQREQLGSTGIGNGIAIPHCRCSNVSQTTGALITLCEPVDFDSIDNHPVDIIFVLLVPKEATDEHLKTLSHLAEHLDKTEFRNQLRKAKSSEELYLAAIQ